MKERPILFSAPMVRAILAGTKTQTRRVAKLTHAGHVKEPGGHRRWHTADFDARLACPYGQPGDRLWVRETWVHVDDTDDKLDGMGSQTYWRASSFAPDMDTEWLHQHKLKWRPSIHMPRWASRITLEITGVRLERLQGISEADAIAEGVTNSLHLSGGRFARDNFAHLWWTINGDGSWEVNPLVWVVEFNRLKGGAA
jgi:hypothetical protein